MNFFRLHMVWFLVGLLPFMATNRSTDPIVKKETAAGQDGFCGVTNNAFSPGEEITYRLFYNWKFVWLAAGEVTFKVEEADNGLYYLSANGETYANYDWFYEVRDLYECYVDQDNLKPMKSIRTVHEGKYTLYDRLEYDLDAGKVHSLRGKTKEEAKESTYDVQPCVHDILSAIYYARNIDFENLDVGAKIPMDIFIDKKTWPLSLTYYGKEEKKIKGNGKFKTIVFGPEVIEGYVFSETNKMRVYVSDDENRMPLLIESPIKIGTAKAVLKDYKNLRHKLTSSKRKR